MKNKNIFSGIVLLVCSVLLLSAGYAQPNIPHITDDYILNQYTGGPAGAGVTDPSFSQIAAGTANFNDKMAHTLVSLFVDPDANICYDGHVKVSVELQVEYQWVSPFGTPSAVLTDYITLEVEKSPLLLTQKDLERSFKVYRNAYKCEVSILSVTAEDENGTSIPVADIPDDIRLEVELQRERYFKIPVAVPGQSTTFLSPDPLENSERYNLDNVFLVSWNPLSWAAEYELEWIFVENFGPSGIGAEIPETALPVQFRDNASRVRVPATQTRFYIPVIYTSGYIVARVRGVTKGGADLEDDLFGLWSFDQANSGTYTVNDVSAGAKCNVNLSNSYLLNHINAQYSIAFSEDGKILPKGTYADGTLRIRQENIAASVYNGDVNDYTKMGVVTETIYDFLGRPAITTLPGVTERGFSYKVNYNQDGLGNKYSYLNFDFETPEAGFCYGPAQGMASNRGVSLYYSSDNPDMSGAQGRLPDAFKLPFTRVVYEADNASRPKIQSGAGPDHAIGSTHETHYVYGNPSQTDLNRLFGTDAGYAGYYQKSMIRDANGQVSITYTDLAGKTIATSLAGKSPETLDPLETMTGGTPLDELGEEVSEDVLEITAQNPHGNKNLLSDDKMSYTASHFMMVTSEKDYLVSYTLNAEDFEDDCIPGFCADCIYDLEISLTDDCGNYIIGNAQGNGPKTIRIPGSIINDQCDESQTFSYDTLVTLQMGAHNLVKKLSLSADAMEAYLQEIMSRDTCLKELSDFFDPPDVSDCYIDCESCLDALGSEDDFVAENTADLGSAAAAKAMYSNLKEQCRNLCGEAYKDECALGWEMMLQDVSLMGQYGEFTGGSASAFPVSVFNVNNELPVRAQEQFINAFTGTPQAGSAEFSPIAAGGLKGSWKRPRYFDPLDNTWKRGYYDELGNRVRITVTQDDNGNWLPEPEVWVTPQTDPLTGERFIYPEHLEHLADFIDNWRATFAQSLVVFHPEYFKYQFCSNAFNYTTQVDDGGGTSVEVNTYEYARMLERYPASVAVSEFGFSGSVTPLAIINAMLAADPFFSDPGSFANQNLMPAGPPVTARNMFFYKLLTYGEVSGVPANIVQVANANVTCGIAPLPPCPLLSSIDFSVSPDADAIWRRTAILYATARQEAMSIAMQVYQITKRNGVHTDCIGNTDYSLPPDVQSTLQYFAGNTVNPCGFPDMFFYAHKDQRFPTFSSMMAEAGFSDPPNPEEFEEYAVQAAQQVTGKCPMLIDFENMLGQLAINAKLQSSIPVFNLSAGPYLGSTLYNHLEALGSFNASINVTPSLITIVTAGSCTTTLSWPSGLPSYYDWSDVYMIADAHGGYLYGYLSDGSETAIEIPFTTCLPLSGCSASGRGICKPTQDIKDLQSLMNALSANNELWTPPADLANYGMFISANLRTILGNESNPASYSWSFTGGTTPFFTLSNTVNSATITLTINTGSSTLGSYPPAIGYTFPSVYQVTPVTITPAMDVAFSFGAVEETGNSMFYIPPGTGVEKLNGTISVSGTLRNVYASDCDVLQDPRCNTEAHKNLNFIYNTISKALQTTEYEMAFAGFTDCIQLLSDSFANGVPFDVSIIESLDLVFADESLSQNGEHSYFGTLLVTLGGGAQTTIRFQSCMPIKNCDPCNEDTCHYSTTVFNFTDFIVTYAPFPPPYATYTFAPRGDNSCHQLPAHSFVYDASYASFGMFLQAWADHINATYANTAGVDAYVSNNSLILDISYAFFRSECDCNKSGVDGITFFDGRRDRTAALSVNDCCASGKKGSNPPPDPEWDVLVPVFDYGVDCYSPVIPFPKDTIEDPCVKYLLDLAAETAYNNYQAYLEEMRNAYREAYRARCMSALETLGTEYESDEYHFTLYYYDRAGNLVRTVPPRAVRRLDLAEMAAVNAARAAGTEKKPEHNDQALDTGEPFLLSTRYRYNTLNQPVLQHTPDGGLSSFYYDNLARLILSQNARQQAAGRVYSYTRYDAQSRITEVGQMRRTDIQNPSQANLHNKLGAAIFFNNGYTKGQFTRTYYDAADFVPASVLYPSGFFNQENLRKRVVCTTYQPEEGFSINDESFVAATHYDYDYHGNVRNMLTDNSYMPDSDPLDISYNFRYHVASYRYDLLSGKVRELVLNPNRQDRFIHRYTYDDQNRLLEASTSKDGYWFDVDARYAYFYHGPLSRIEYGPYKSQGTDYTYTIHGWLKSINSENLYPRREPGNDGYTGAATRFVARDAYGMALTYFENDYFAINGTQSDFLLAVPPVYYNNRNLYNGNIVAMNNVQKQTGNPDLAEPLLQVFAYDQLNRIKGSHSYIQRDHYSAISNWNPSAPETDMFRTRYWYDHDGNISTLHRFDKQEVNFDRFTYHYTPGTNQLQWVEDAIAPGVVNYDVEEQVSGNYGYDAIGNLLHDNAEDIEDIRWNIYGKVTAVYRSSGSSKPGLEFMYDAAGRRIAKTVIPAAGNKWTEFYTLNAQGNILAIYRAGTDDEDEHYLRLTENVMYGSNRLGTWTRDELIRFEAQAPAVQSLHRGTKQYELSDHLGNVHVTLSDRKRLICDDEEAQYYEPEIRNTYDYYAFGMLMEERKQYRGNCELISDTTYTEVFNDQFSSATTDWFYVDDMSNPAVTGGNMRLTKANVSLVRLFTAIPGKQYRMRFRVTLPPCLSSVMVLANLDNSSTMLCTASQAYEFVFTANSSSGGVGFIAPIPYKGCVLDIDYVILEEMNITDSLVCEDDTAAYRFGFNGQMKDNEISGIDGGHLSFEYRIHDARIGRFLSVDPLFSNYPYNSPYAFAQNCVISGADLEGKEHELRINTGADEAKIAAAIKTQNGLTILSAVLDVANNSNVYNLRTGEREPISYNFNPMSPNHITIFSGNGEKMLELQFVVSFEGKENTGMGGIRLTGSDGSYFEVPLGLPSHDANIDLLLSAFGAKGKSTTPPVMWDKGMLGPAKFFNLLGKIGKALGLHKEDPKNNSVSGDPPSKTFESAPSIPPDSVDVFVKRGTNTGKVEKMPTNIGVDTGDTVLIYNMKIEIIKK